MMSAPLSPSAPPAAPKLTLEVLPGRDYAIIVQQTKVVYDQLLLDKQQKQMAVIIQEKEKLDAQCSELSKGNVAKAMEFSVCAQKKLNEMNTENHMELTELAEDYQAKLNKMVQEMETKWQKDHGGK